jgi:asparagine synthase (glutamine-hydrolysing)
MCGIAGSSTEDKDVIERMTSALKHRGPDGHATEVVDGASLGHARLAILDPRPEGNQPMWNDDNTIAIVYNGEIYNFKALRAQENLACRTATDTEVLLRLYEKEGISFVKKLRGMFAFGIYDTKEKTWLLARDPSGIKPLFYSVTNGNIAFASEMRALMKALPQKPALNMNALSQYMQLQYVPGPHTLCKGIESLPPGTVLIWKERQKYIERIPPQKIDISYTSTSQFRSEFPSLMDEVVKDHLVSDKPVGIFLSGGMDSSILLHHMSHHAEKPLRTFTVRFDATEEEDATRFNTDADLAAMTAKEYGTDHYDIFLSAKLCKTLYRETACALDQPNADAVATAQVLLSREAKKVVDVVLIGAGGDELFGGYPRYRIAKILNALRCVPAPLRIFAGRLTGNPSDVLGMSPGALLAERLLARPTKEIVSVSCGTWFDATATSQLFEERFKSLHLDPTRNLMEFDRALWLVDESLRLADATTMANGLEGRVPFLDPRIIAASHGTQSDWHVGYKRTKVLLKDTYKPLLPEHLFILNKACFFPPLAKWIRRECAPLVGETFDHKRIKELFDVKKLRVLFEKHKTKEQYALHTLSSVTQLRYWFEEVYDA